MKKKGVFYLCVVFMLTISAFVITSVGAEQTIKLPIIMYHSVVKDEERRSDYVVSLRQFKEDIEAIDSAGYNTVNIADLISYVGGGELPKKPIMITFDDGFLNNVDLCGPVLKEHGMKAVLSVVGVYTECEEKCDWKRSDNYSYLTWEEISRAQKKGIFEIQNHSYNMHGGNGRQGAKKFSGEDAQTFKMNIGEDVCHMQALLEQKSGIRASCFTYPFGYFDSDTKEVIRQSGFSASLICYEKINELTREADCLYGLGRFNRSGCVETAGFFEKCGIDLS